MSKLLISENERKNILSLYNLIQEDLTPLQKLMQCKFTPDGKYVVYEGKAYRTEDGQEVPLNEAWTLSDILHTGADILSVGMDFVIPGSGAVVDTLNALSYVIEAQFKNAEEKDSLYLMAAITFAFVILPGPLQALSVPLKRAIKTGVGMASPVVVKALKIIGGSLDTLLLGIPSKINAALKSPLAKNILGKYSGKISGFIDGFTKRVKSILSKLTGKAGKEGAEKASKEGAEKASKEGAEKASKEGAEVAANVFQKKHTLGDVGTPDEWWNLSKDELNNLVKKQENLVSSSVNGLIKKTDNLVNKSFNPSQVNILSKSNISGREIMEVQLENGQNVIFYKVTGMGGKTLPPPGAWSVVPGFIDNAFVQGKRVRSWFVKNGDTIGLTHTSVKGGGSNKYLTEMSQFLEKNGTEGLGKKTAGEFGGAAVDNAIKLLPVSVGAVSKELLPAIVSKSSYLSKLSNVKLGNNAGIVLSKLGIVPKKLFNFGKKSFNIKNVEGEYIDFVEIVGGKEVVKKTKVWDFLKTYILQPSARLNTVAVPVITKAVVRLFNNGTLNTEELKKMPNIDSNQAQKDLTQLSTLVAEYEGDKGKYTVNTNAKVVQQSLMKLGYPLPRFKDDGKFGPETMKALKKFQEDNKLTSSIGKMDKLTSRKLAELLKSKNITGSEELQKSLNSM